MSTNINKEKWDLLLADTADRAETFDLSDGLTAYSYEQPGTVLDLNFQESIFEQYVPVTSAAFGADMTVYWRERRAGQYFQKLSELILITDGSGALVGWTGFTSRRLATHVVHYIDSSGLLPSFQSRGIMYRVWRGRLLARMKSDIDLPNFVSARSESPILYRLIEKVLRPNRVYPAANMPTPHNVLRVGNEMASWLGQADIIQEGTLTLRGAYASLDALYDTLPSTGDENLDSLFRDQLGPLDAYILLAQITKNIE